MEVALECRALGTQRGLLSVQPRGQCGVGTVIVETVQAGLLYPACQPVRIW